MTEVRVIARAVARKGNEAGVKALLQSMLAPTRAESECKLYGKRLTIPTYSSAGFFGGLWG